MKDTNVIETRKVKDHVFRLRAYKDGSTFWTIEYYVSDEVPPEVTRQRAWDAHQRKMEKAKKAKEDLPENPEERK